MKRNGRCARSARSLAKGTSRRSYTCCQQQPTLRHSAKGPTCAGAGNGNSGSKTPQKALSVPSHNPDYETAKSIGSTARSHFP